MTHWGKGQSACVTLLSSFGISSETSHNDYDSRPLTTNGWEVKAALGQSLASDADLSRTASPWNTKHWFLTSYWHGNAPNMGAQLSFCVLQLATITLMRHGDLWNCCMPFLICWLNVVPNERSIQLQLIWRNGHFISWDFDVCLQKHIRRCHKAWWYSSGWSLTSPNCSTLIPLYTGFLQVQDREI